MTTFKSFLSTHFQILEYQIPTQTSHYQSRTEDCTGNRKTWCTPPTHVCTQVYTHVCTHVHNRLPRPQVEWVTSARFVGVAPNVVLFLSVNHVPQIAPLGIHLLGLTVYRISPPRNFRLSISNGRFSVWLCTSNT